MNSIWLNYWRFSVALALVWSLVWLILIHPSNFIQPVAQLFWLVTPWIWFVWWTRKGHYKPIFLAQLLTVLYAIFSMSYLIDPEWPYALIAVAFWLITFYTGFKHLKIIKTTLINQFNAK